MEPLLTLFTAVEDYLGHAAIALVAANGFLSLCVIFMMVLRLFRKEDAYSVQNMVPSEKGSKAPSKKETTKDTKETTSEPITAEPLASLSPPPVQAETVPTHPVSPAASAPVTDSAAAQSEEASLQEKVKFLENKLLEYEILQEEISLLSSLKAENEKLRAQLVTQSGAAAAQAQPTTVPEATAPPVAPSPPEALTK